MDVKQQRLFRWKTKMVYGFDMTLPLLLQVAFGLLGLLAVAVVVAYGDIDSQPALAREVLSDLAAFAPRPRFAYRVAGSIIPPPGYPPDDPVSPPGRSPAMSPHRPH